MNPEGVRRAEESFREWMAQLVTSKSVDDLIAEAAADPLPEPWETVEVYDLQDTKALLSIMPRGSRGRDRVVAHLARLEEG